MGVISESVPRKALAHFRRAPLFDPDTRTLWFGRTLVKRLTKGRPATNQILILTAFLEQQWALAIDDPLPIKRGICPKKRLKDAIEGLNNNHVNHVIKFHSNGTSRGISWEIIG